MSSEPAGEDVPPSTPSRRPAPRRLGDDWSPSSLGGDSPERTPGPGEASPDLSADLRELQGGSSELASLLAEAEERSNRRAAAIRGVLEGIRTSGPSRQIPPLPLESPVSPAPVSSLEGSVVDSPAVDMDEASLGGRLENPASREQRAERSSEEDLQPRSAPPPPTPLPAATVFVRPVPGRASAAAAAAPPPVRQAQTDPRRSGERERLEHWEQHQHDLERALLACQEEQEAAQEAREALSRCQADCELLEGNAARREAELRREILDLRSQHSRERERLRAEAKRLQGALKESHVRARAEGEAKGAASEQADTLRQQLSAGRVELQRKARECQDLKTLLATFEERSRHHRELAKWVVARCSEAAGEDFAQPKAGKDTDGAATAEDQQQEDAVRLALTRTIALTRRKKHEADHNGVAAERLNSMKSELQKAKTESEQLRQSEQALQERLLEAEQSSAASATPAPKAAQFSLRTEVRGRVRAAEDAQKKLQHQLQEQAQEMEQLHTHIAALQRAKEAGEKYVETEEDAWIQARQAAKTAESEAASAFAAVRRFEVEAREASDDAVAARAAAHGAEACRKRLEAELADLQQKIASRTAWTQHEQEVEADSPLAFPATRDACPADTQLRVREAACVREAMEAQRHVGEWRAAAEHASAEVAQLRQSLASEEAGVQRLERRCEAALEAQRDQQQRVDEAKRSMMQNALKEQADRLRDEFQSALQHAQQLNDEQSAALCDFEKQAEMHKLELEETEKMREANKAEKAAWKQEMLELSEAGISREHDLKIELELEAQLQKELERLYDADARAQVQLGQQAVQLAQALASAEATEAAGKEVSAEFSAAQQKEISELHQEFRSHLQSVHGEHAGECAALRAVEDETRQLCEKELSSARKDHAAMIKAAEAASAGEAAEARLARAAVREEAVSARARRTVFREEVRETVQAELGAHLRELHAEAAGRSQSGLEGLSQESRALLTELRSQAQQALCADVRSNPRSELRRALCRDIKQELRDQLKSEMMSEMRQNRSSVSEKAASSRGSPCGYRVLGSPLGPEVPSCGPIMNTVSTIGPSSSRRAASATCSASPPTAADSSGSCTSESREDLTRRGGELMEAFAQVASDEAVQNGEPSSALSVKASAGRDLQAGWTLPTAPPVPRLWLPIPGPGRAPAPSESLEGQASAVLAQVLSARSRSARS
eukprot:TRINITY_DN36361_c0_g1_i2.p1 TRINITY_DN36361_c0_g1~~TRINITY_DN36361_c0_g1_i2.p1  ORF type:complete len:1192 (+),score=350.04 TRINITY_DN36361_c0_g1_i2:90-3665(+)